MEMSGLPIRRMHAVVPPAVEYHLTLLGTKFVELVELPYSWGRESVGALDHLIERPTSRR